MTAPARASWSASEFAVRLDGAGSVRLMDAKGGFHELSGEGRVLHWSGRVLSALDCADR